MTKNLTKKLIGEAMRQDFWLFLNYGFGAKFYCETKRDEDWLDSTVHENLANWFQKHVEEWESWRRAGIRKTKKLLVCIPRGFGKSTAITAAGSCWLHLRNPELVTLISSYGEERSAAFLGVIKSVFEGKSSFGWWNDVYGSWEPTDGREWKVTSIVHAMRKHTETRDPSFEITSINKGATGGRPDVFILDDPISEDKIGEDPNHVDKAVRHFRSMEFAVKTNGLWIVALTRKTDADVASAIMSADGVKSFAETGMRPKDVQEVETGVWDVFFMSARDPLGKPTLPRVWTDDKLNEVERVNPLRFAAELMNEPAEGRHAPLKKEFVDKLYINYDQIPPDLRYSVHIDTAFKEREKVARGDDNVIALVGHSTDGSGIVYFLDALVSNRWNSEQFLEQLVGLYQRLKMQGKRPFAMTDENVGGGKQGLFEQAVQSHFHAVGMSAPQITFVTRTKASKESRIRISMDYWLMGKVRLVRGHLGIDKLAHQMIRYGIVPFDDVAEAFSDCFMPGVYVPEKRMKGQVDNTVAMKRPLDDYIYPRREKKKDDELSIMSPWWN